jgi:formate/nitrite transporter FocA (FNT family)
VLVSNFVGCVFTVYIFADLTDLFSHEPWTSYAKDIAVTKINLKPEVAFLRAIPANALVCTSLLLGQQSRDMIGKLVRL